MMKAMPMKTSPENVTLLHYFNLFIFFRNSELSRSQIGRSGIQVKKENEKLMVVCSRSHQNLEFGHFTLWI